MCDEAYFLSHNGLGDNLYSIGALRFLSNYYRTIYFICKEKYYPNVRLLFMDTNAIVCVPVDSENEIPHASRIIREAYLSKDVFVCGNHKRYLHNKITNKKLLKILSYAFEHPLQDENTADFEEKNKRQINTIKNPNKYTINYDQLSSQNYKFIEDFYTSIRLNLTVFFDYWYIPETEYSKLLYDMIKSYYIIFLQTTSSDGKRLNIDNIIHKHLYDPKTILISNDENLYHDTDQREKAILAQQFVKIKLVYYFDTIFRSDEIYIIDSCFVGIVLPLVKKNYLTAKTVRIILRDNASSTVL